MIVRSESAPSGGPVVGAGSVRPRTIPPTRPSPASEKSLPKTDPDSPLITPSPRHDPATVHLLEQLVREREPSLDQLLRERNRIPEFYTPMGALFEERLYWLMREQNTRGLVRTWDGRIPK